MQGGVREGGRERGEKGGGGLMDDVWMCSKC